MKRVVLILVILILFSSSYNLAFSQNTKLEGNKVFYPQEVSLSDDAFHGRGRLPFIEWWYFDAEFDNGYSAQLSVSVYGLLGKALVFERMALYENSTLIKRSSKTFTFKDIFASKEIPFVQINGNTVISGTNNLDSGNFEYNASFDFSDASANLKFIGSTKGWKAQHQSKDWWAVMLPRSDVTGLITVDNKTISVTGTGYHDHNWGISFRSFTKFGWFWGKIYSQNYSLVWSVDFLTRTTEQPILVVNKADAGFYEIPSDAIYFSMKDFKFDHLKIVPRFFHIEAMTSNVTVIVNMEVISIDFQHVLNLVHYWRYHVKCTGFISIDGQIEQVDDVVIAEYCQLH